MKTLTASHITYKQREILKLLYTHRYLTRIHIQAFLKHKDKKTIYLWLKDLKTKGYIEWIYNKDQFVDRSKPAIYYLAKSGINHFREFDTHDEAALRKRYRDNERSQGFIDHCLVVADVCISLEDARNEDTYPQYWYFYETEADYLSDSYYHFLADSELIHPDICFSKQQYDGMGEPYTVESCLLEVFDPTLPQYRLRYRLKQYITYCEEELDDWETETLGDPKPTILLVCATVTDLIYAKRRTRGLIADIWERNDEDRPEIKFTTTEKLKEQGVLGENWEKV